MIQCPDGQMKTFPLTGERLAGGRGSAADLCFPEDAGLSRMHFAFEAIGEDWTIQDLGSRNGTFVNNIPLKARLMLKPGDRITAGHLIMIFGPWTYQLSNPGFVVFNERGHIGDAQEYRKDIHKIHSRPGRRFITAQTVPDRCQSSKGAMGNEAMRRKGQGIKAFCRQCGSDLVCSPQIENVSADGDKAQVKLSCPRCGMILWVDIQLPPKKPTTK